MQGMARSHSAPETVEDHSRVMVVIGPSCNQRPPTHAAQSFGCQSAASHSHGAVFLQPPAAIGGFQPTWRKVPATVQSAASHLHGTAWEGLRPLQPGSLAPVPQHQYQPPSMAMGAHLPMQPHARAGAPAIRAQYHPVHQQQPQEQAAADVYSVSTPDSPSKYTHDVDNSWGHRAGRTPSGVDIGIHVGEDTETPSAAGKIYAPTFSLEPGTLSSHTRIFNGLAPGVEAGSLGLLLAKHVMETDAGNQEPLLPAICSRLDSVIQCGDALWMQTAERPGGSHELTAALLGPVPILHVSQFIQRIRKYSAASASVYSLGLVLAHKICMRTPFLHLHR